MKAGTTAIFDFQFVKSGTMEPVKVNTFVFTVFDLDEYKNCHGRMSVNAWSFIGLRQMDAVEVLPQFIPSEVLAVICFQGVCVCVFKMCCSMTMHCGPRKNGRIAVCA